MYFFVYLSAIKLAAPLLNLRRLAFTICMKHTFDCSCATDCSAYLRRRLSLASTVSLFIGLNTIRAIISIDYTPHLYSNTFVHFFSETVTAAPSTFSCPCPCPCPWPSAYLWSGPSSGLSSGLRPTCGLALALAFGLPVVWPSAYLWSGLRPTEIQTTQIKKKRYMTLLFILLVKQVTGKSGKSGKLQANQASYTKVKSSYTKVKSKQANQNSQAIYTKVNSKLLYSSSSSSPSSAGNSSIFLVVGFQIPTGSCVLASYITPDFIDRR